MRTAAPLSLMTLTVIAMVTSTAHAEIAWRDNLRVAHAEAQAEGKQLLLHFYSDNCVWCDKLEAGAFKTSQVQATVNEQFVPVKVHAGQNPKLTEMFAVKKFPTDVVVTTQGETLSHSVSPQDPSRYIAMLQAALPHASAANTAAPLVAATDGAAKDLPVSTTGLDSQRTNEFNLPSARPGQATTQLASSRSEEPDLTMPLHRPLPSAAAESALNPQHDSSKSRPEQKQPELAIQGFCAVSVIEEDRWVEGNPDFGVIHLGKLYLFGSAEKLERFLDDPVPYTPVLNEIDVVRFIEERRIVPGKREWGLKDPVHQRMFFFADEAAMNHFWNKYELYTEAAVKIMDRAVRDTNPGS